MNQTLNFFVFNIKLQSEKIGEERTKAYIRLIERLASKPYKYFQTGKSEAIVLFGPTASTDNDIPNYLYGRAAKGFYVPGEERKVLSDGEIVSESNDPNALINPEVSKYLFFPDAHRLFLERRKGAPNQFEVEKYLKHELNKYIDSEDLLEIVLEKDENAIKQIFAARVVHSISYKVSYTNEDFLDDLAADYDKELKDNNIGEISVFARSDNHVEGLKIENSKMLGGGLKLAESNGEIRSASITPNDNKGKKITVTNKDKPKVLQMKFEEKDSFWDKWYNTVRSIYRNT